MNLVGRTATARPAGPGRPPHSCGSPGAEDAPAAAGQQRAPKGKPPALPAGSASCTLGPRPPALCPQPAQGVPRPAPREGFASLASAPSSPNPRPARHPPAGCSSSTAGRGRPGRDGEERRQHGAAADPLPDGPSALPAPLARTCALGPRRSAVSAGGGSCGEPLRAGLSHRTAEHREADSLLPSGAAGRSGEHSQLLAERGELEHRVVQRAAALHCWQRAREGSTEHAAAAATLC